MKKSHIIWSIVCTTGLLLVVALLSAWSNSNNAYAQNLQDVWENVRQSGAYTFSADVTQTTQANDRAIAYGPSTQKTRVHLEGATDIYAGSLDLTLWNSGGSVLAPETGTQIKIADGVAQARWGAGPWQEIDDFSGALAPGGDFLAMLSAAENVVRHAPETKDTVLGKITVTRFTFDINGALYAAYLRDLLSTQMQARGELPPSMQLDLPVIYAQMTGRGELWVGPDGLPIRQQFELTFPEGTYGSGQGQGEVETDVYFRSFGSEAASAPIHADAASLAALGAIVLIVVLLCRSRSRPVYAAVALSVSFSLLASPLLNSMLFSAYGRKQAEKQTAQAARQAELESADAWQAALAEPNFDPHASPLGQVKTWQARAQEAQNGANSQTTSSTVSTSSDNSTYFDSSCETDPGSDNDGDSLTNLEECLIGTLPGAVDTDQDGVDDDQEVKGFALDDISGVTWYTNPLLSDTNRDGLPDGSEWNMDADNNGKPDDTDADGVPDLWDDDNDGDGVPDNLDLSPYTTTKNTHIFDGDNPMQLIVDDLGEGLITKVEFQLTPTNPEHLWYTNNVLDWSDNDKQGQMQDADGLSFYDVDNTINPWPNDLGDVRLVPMLEIEITGSPNNLPDDATLKQYGISVVTATTDSEMAYVPVQLVTDSTGDKNVAFHGAMYYRADSSWGNAQSVRLVWLVQALVDVCDTYKNGVCDTYSTYNDLQVIHSIDDEWFLTGMEVSEEHGTNMAIIYEDPTETNDEPLYMNTLYEMTYGLDRIFLAGADCENIDANNDCVSGNGALDMTVNDIDTRFNHATNSNIPADERWGLSNVLNVEENSYESIELAMMDTVVTQTVSILDAHFTSDWSASEPITPTIMYAWEQSYRAVSLSSNNLSWANNVLTVDVATSGANIVPVEQVNGIKWAPYAYNSSDGWFSADIDTYWNDLDNLLPGYLSGSDDVPTDTTMAKLLYLGMYSGETSNVKYGDLLITKDYQTSDEPLAVKFATVAGTGMRKVVSYYFGGSSAYGRIIRDAVESLDEDIGVIERFSLKIQYSLEQLYSKLQSIGTIGLGLLIITSIAVLVVSGLYLYSKFVAHDKVGQGLLIAGVTSIAVITFALSVVKPLKVMIDQIDVLIELGEAEDTVEAVQIVFGGEGAPNIEYNVLGLIIAVTLSLVIFMVLTFSGQVKVGTLAFNTLIAQTLAAIIVAVIVFALNLSGIGALLLGIATVIDIILYALGINFSILEKLTDVIAGALYEFDMSVDTGINTGSISTDLLYPDEGMAAGNQMIFTIPITTVITQTDDVTISSDQFRSNSFVYDLDQEDAYQSGLSTTHGDRASDWEVVQYQKPHDFSTFYYYHGVISDTVSYAATLLPGVNRSFTFYLDSAYDLLGESCWWIAGCKDKYVNGTSSTEIGSSFIFDIYPATLDEFVDVGTWSNGSIRFPDADGDGLLPLGEGGVDPDDTTWDVDGDGLSDQFELSMRALSVAEGGEALNPMLADTDGDGLNDKEELLLATNPNNGDSDEDGLPDIDEAARVDEALLALSGGWLFDYRLDAYTRVWSDPNSPDYDGDGMSDLFELTQDTCPDCTPWADPDNPLLFSPYVYNENPVPIYLDDNTNDGFISPSSSFVYSTTTENNLSDGILLAGDVVLELPDIFSGGPLTDEVALTSGYSQTLASEITPMVGNSATGVLTSTMDLETFEDVVWAWDAADTNSLSPAGGDIKNLDAAVAPGFSDLYVFTALEIDASGEQHITAYTAGNEGNPSDSVVLFNLPQSLGTYGAPEIACNDAGNCLIVWAFNGQGTGEILGTILNGSLSNHSGALLFRFASSYTLSSPVVTSDGEDFMIAWSEDTGSQTSTLATQVYTDGTTSSLLQVWQSNFHGGATLGLVWTGSNYLVVWISAYDAVMYRAEIDPSLNVGTVTVFPDHTFSFISANGVEGPLSLTYDPLSNQALLIYRDLDEESISTAYMNALRLTASGSSAEMHLDSVDKSGGLAYADIAACADPQNGGWIMAWSKNQISGDMNVHYQAMAPDGNLRSSEQLVSTTQNNVAVALACRTPHPALDLEFEEEATSATYADSSQYGHDATCNLGGGDCPIGGVEGRFGNGVLFDGVNDQLTSSFSQSASNFTVEFWLNTTCQDCDILNHLGGNAAIYLNNGEVCSTTYGTGGISHLCSSSGNNFADGEWHHIMHAADGAAQYLWLDGHIQVYTNSGSSIISCTSNCNQFVLGTAGNNFFDGTLDEVRFHNRTFSSAEAFQAFNSAISILDLDETAGATTAYDATHNGFNATCSGTTCPTFGVDGVANTAVEFDGSNDSLVIDSRSETLESYVYDFEDRNTSGWSDGALSTATRDGTQTTHLGPFGNQDVTLDLTNLPTHDTVKIAFDLYVLGPWDGNRTDLGRDSWKWGYDSTTVLQSSFSNQPDTSPNYQSYPAWYDYPATGIILYENSDLSGVNETFASDDPDLRDNTIGNDRASAFAPIVGTAAILYSDINYGGTSWIMDPKRGNINVPTNDTVSSLRVFSSLHSPGYDSTGDPLLASGFSETSVYHIEYTLDAHTADSLSLFFAGVASDPGQERWGLDNVVVEVQSDGGSVPLTNSSFTFSAWAKRDTSGSGDYIISQGTRSSGQGVYFGYKAYELTCAIWGNELDWSLVNDGAWHHVACTYNSGLNKLTLYYDGAEVGTLTTTADYSGFGETFVGDGLNGEYFDGALDEVALWTLPLTSDQILELYQKVRVEDQAVLHTVAPVQNDSSLLTVDLILRETSTGTGTEAQVVTRTIGIDADSPSISILAPLAGAYITGLQTLEISGSASDPTSHVKNVEVQIDGGSWMAAYGAESWSYTVPAGTLGDGLHTASARATDIVGFTGNAASAQFVVDDTAPEITISTQGTLRPIRDDQGSWLVPISGTAADPAAGSQSGSGVASVEVLLQGGTNVVGNGWQPTTLSGGDWTLDYVLPQVGTGGTGVSNPTGIYTVTLRATDEVNNTTPESAYVTEQLALEVDPPVPTLTTSLPVTQPITTALTLSGVISDATFISSAEIGFIPGGNISALSEAVLHLPLNENQAHTRYFSDRSGSNNPAGCILGSCPTVGQPGQHDLALEFNGQFHYAVVPDNHSIDFGPDDDFTVALWVYADPSQPSTQHTDNDIVEKWSGGNGGYPYVIRYMNQSGIIRVARYDGQNQPIIDSSVAVSDGQFHHIAFVKSGETLSLYVDGVLNGTTTDTTTGDTTNNSDLYLGMRGNDENHFKGILDELVIHDRALADYEIADLYNYGLITWEPITFDSGVLNPTWSYTIPEGANGLEGLYQINVRATDVFSNTTEFASQRLWRGEIDTRPPTLEFTATAGTLSTLYSCDASDFNLDEDSSCQVVPPDTIPDFGNGNITLTTYDQQNLWYANVISDTSRLYNMYATLTLGGSQPTDMSLQACDVYGRCTIAGANTTASLNTDQSLAAVSRRLAQINDTSLGAELISPANGTVLTATTPITVTGIAIADAGLQTLSVTADGVEIYTQNWPVTPTITSTVWSFAWTPPGQGSYPFGTSVTDWQGTTAGGTLTPTIHVDLEPPEVAISPTVLSTSHQLGDASVRLMGTASDAIDVFRVEVGVDGGPWQNADLADDGSWQFPWHLNSQPDGEAFNVSARATDLAGQTALANETVLVDIVPPEPITITLAYMNDQGQLQPLMVGETLTDAVSLEMTWTASSDGSGITSYNVGWSQSPTPDPAELTTYPGEGTHVQLVGEAETWYAHVQIVDGTGNVTSQSLGPVYVDGLLTPDVIDDVSYHGWADDVCTIEGVDRRLAQVHPGFYGDDRQRFYVSWDKSALRLYWEGANWNHDGDLFVYLDTRPGGSTKLYNPYPDDANTTIYLPGNFPEPDFSAGLRQQNAQASLSPQFGFSAMGADFMVWVEDGGQATLYRWDGFAWVVASELDNDHYQLRVGVAGSDTDLWLPFDEIGIADPATAALGLLAVATEEEALRLWATMPVRNPVNSARVVNPLAGQADEHTFPLVRGYFWDNLDSGLCGNGRLNGDGTGPTGGPYADSDLQLSLTADPVGTTYNFMNDEMAWLWSLLFGFKDVPVVPSQLFDHLDTEHPPLGPGQTITYTIAYENLGTETAKGVTVDLQDWFSLQLTGGSSLDLGDIPPGATGSAQVTAFIDPTGLASAEQEWASLDALVYDEQYPGNPDAGVWSAAPLEWMWSDNQVDVQPPAVSITAPEFVIPAGEVNVRGKVDDESPVPLITLQVLDDRGNTDTIECKDDTPSDSQWACVWDAGSATDGEIFQLRAQATDRFGQIGEWTPWLTVEVDATPPVVTFSEKDLLFGPGIHYINGNFSDERQIGSVYICREDNECTVHAVDPQPDVSPGALAKTGIWTSYLTPPTDLQADGQVQTLLLYGQDAAGNRSEPFTITYRMDNTPPALDVTFAAAFVPEIGAHLILEGTVADGSHVDLSVLVDPPSGARLRLKAAVVGNDWSFIHTFAETGVYTVWVQAVDAVGNRTTVGPYTVLAGEANKIYLPIGSKNATISRNEQTFP